MTEHNHAPDLDRLHQSLQTASHLIEEASTALRHEWSQRDMERCEAILCGALAVLSAERSRAENHFSIMHAPRPHDDNHRDAAASANSSQAGDLRVSVGVEQLDEFRVIHSGSVRRIGLAQKDLLGLAESADAGENITAEELQRVTRRIADSLRSIDFAADFIVAHGEPCGSETADRHAMAREEAIKRLCNRPPDHQAATDMAHLSLQEDPARSGDAEANGGRNEHIPASDRPRVRHRTLHDEATARAERRAAGLARRRSPA